MLHDPSDAVNKRTSSSLVTGSKVLRCPQASCGGFAFPPDLRCTLCRRVVHLDLAVNGSPPVKQPRVSNHQVVTPILILSIGKDGIFDARNGPCVITPSSLTFRAKVEGAWTPVVIQSSEIESLVFCEELQVLFLEANAPLKQALTSTLRLNCSRIFNPDSIKWIILVLGERMTNSPEKNLLVQQLEIFGASIREHNGECTMNYTCMDTKKLLLTCGLRLPRAEAKLQSVALNPSGSNPDNGLTSVSTDSASSTTSVISSATTTRQPSSTDTERIAEGGLLTNVISTLSSAGMHFFGRSETHDLPKKSPALPEGLTTNSRPKTDNGNEDLIILSEEDTDGDKSAFKPASVDCYSDKNSGVSAANFREPSFKFDYQPVGSTDSVTLTSADLQCLAPDALVNDAIINFYLKYLYFEQLTELQRRATYLFNCFFYSRLACISPTTPVYNPRTKSIQNVPVKRSPVGDTLSDLAMARHASVAKWTRRVDLFMKDCIIIPINEASHWFLGLVCFPWMAGMVSYTALYQAEAFDLCKLTDEFANVDQILFSDDVDDKSISEEPIERKSVDIKGASFDQWRRRRLAWLRKRGINAMPCILLFDSLPCQTRTENLRVIREYLQAEWDCRRAEYDGLLSFNKDTIRGFSPRVPSQSNLVDCGIYLLHYVEMFFKKPVQSYTKDYFQNEMASWFSEATVGQKRSEIYNLIKRLSGQHVQPNMP
ncbi:unnamed protein product [Calicophoron daubneyi]|uniref:Ubiquitin-like protease family profile domain-containing protein n=1 Tax=Calicophoron daubneyi TaxID=300641 RepID=A0AAV2TVV3_CALDB